MSASFASASSQSLQLATTTLLANNNTWAVGLWVYPTTTGADRTIFAYSDTATADRYHEIRQTSGDQWAIASNAGAGEASAAAGTVTANQWHFLLGRLSGAASRFIEVLTPDGAASSNSNTTSVNPAGLDTLALGGRVSSSPTQFFDGLLAEFWLINGMQLYPASLATGLLYPLAFDGPFAMAHIAKDIVDYRSLRLGGPNVGQVGDIFNGGGSTSLIWTDSNTVTFDPMHPPLPGRYQRHGDEGSFIPF